MQKIKARSILAFVAVIGYILITAGFFVLLFAGDRINIPEGDVGKQLIGMFGLVIGNWGGWISLVFVFSYGTTQGSSEKTETINQVLRNVAPLKDLPLRVDE